MILFSLMWICGGSGSVTVNVPEVIRLSKAVNLGLFVSLWDVLLCELIERSDPARSFFRKTKNVEVEQ